MGLRGASNGGATGACHRAVVHPGIVGIWLLALLAGAPLGSAWAAAAGIPGPIQVESKAPDGVCSVTWGATATAGAIYRLEESGDSAFATPRLAYQGSALSAEVGPRPEGQVYFYRVRAQKTGLASSAWVAGSNACAVPGTALVSPDSIRVAPSDSDGRFSVVWGAAPMEGVTYRLQESTGSNFGSGVRTAYLGPERSAPIAGRASGKTYYYRVRAEKTGYSGSPWRGAANGVAVTPNPLVGRWVWVEDSDGTVPSAGAECALVLLDGGRAEIDCYMPSESYHDHGTFGVSGVAGGALQLSLDLPDWGASLTNEPLTLQSGRLTLPFMAMSWAEGTSVWERQATPAVDRTDFVALAFQVYEEALQSGLSDGDAALAAADALRLGSFADPVKGVVTGAPSAPSSKAAAAAAPLAEVRLNAQKTAIGARLENGRLYWILLKGKSPAGAQSAPLPSREPLAPGSLAGDPRTQLLMNKGSGRNDPAKHQASLLFPMHSPTTFRKGRYYAFKNEGEDPDELRQQIADAGYADADIRVRIDGAASPKTLANELLKRPGVFYLSTHGAYFEATADQPAELVFATGTKVTMAPGKTREQSLSDAVIALGLPDYLEGTLVPVAIQTGRLVEETYLGVGAAFFEALKANNPGWGLTDSLVYLDACSSTAHADGQVPLAWSLLGTPRALIGWREPSGAFEAARYSRHFFANARRKTHSAREVWDETGRVLSSRRSIYAEDSLLDDALGWTRASLAEQYAIYEAFGADGKPYLRVGDGLYRNTLPDIVNWLVWLGRWNQSSYGAAKNLKSCYDDIWSKGIKGLAAGPLCNAGYVGSHTPTANEVKESRQLIDGAPAPIPGGRWTLADKLPYR
jgi:hypothetical protein